MGTYGPFVGPLDGLVSQFHFDDNLNDAVGTSAIAVASGTTTFVSDAERGYALDTEPGKHVISGGGLGALLDQQSWTISFWFYADTSATQTILGRSDFWDNNANYERGGFFVDYLSDKRLRFRRWYYENGQQWVNIMTLVNSVSLDTWHHVTLTSVPGHLAIYVNGVSAATGGVDGKEFTELYYQTTALYDKVGVGTRCETTSDSTDTCLQDDNGKGYLQDLRFYNRALSATEIGELAGGQASACRSCGSGLTTLAPGENSLDACVCQTGSYNSDLIVNTDDHSMDKSDTAANDCATESKACRLTGSMPFPFSTTGVTMVMKIRMSGTKSDWERVFALGQTQPTAYTTGDINVFRHDGNQQLKFNVYLINSCHVDHAYTFTQNEDLTVWIRYNPSTQQMQMSVNSQVQTTSGCTMPSLLINQFVAGADHDYGSRSNMNMAGFQAFGRFLTEKEINTVANSIAFGTDDSVKECLTCPTGLTTLAPEADSADACACQTGSFKAPIKLPGLNALYLFDSDTRDSSGNGYDLTMTNGATDPYSFLGANGVDPSLMIKDESTLLTRTATVASQNLLNNIVNGKPVCTLAVWVKDIRFVDGNDHQYGILGLNWADGKWFRLDVYASGKLVFVLYGGAWGTTSMFPECQNSPDWTRGGWWHIVFTSDGTNVGMQYRSAADASYTSCTLLSEQSGNPVISTWTATGSVSASSIETFKVNAVNALNPGTLIDEVRVYNRVLSSEEILQVFDEKNNVCKSCGAGLTTLAPGAESADACVCSVGSFKTDAYDTNLIAHYGFDGDTRDLQNPGNVATLTGNGGIAYLDTTHKIFGSHSVKLTNDDGLKTYVLIPQFQLDTSLTISLWFRWDVTSLHDSDYTKLFYFSGDVKLYAAGDSSVSGDGEALYFVMYDQNNNRIEYKNSDRFYFSNNVWYHISWVLNRNSDMRIYVDGEYVQRTNTDKLESGKFPLWDASANMNNNRIGTHVSSDDGRDSIDGHVEEFRLYNTALPDSAVKALYEARGATCMSCSSGLTTLAPGANSSNACVCPSGSFTNPLPPAVLHWNPSLADENMDGTAATGYTSPAANWNIATNGGFTIIMKMKITDSSDRYAGIFHLADSSTNEFYLRIGRNEWQNTFILENTPICHSEWPHLTFTYGVVYTIVYTYDASSQKKGFYYSDSPTFSRTCPQYGADDSSCEISSCTGFSDYTDLSARIGSRHETPGQSYNEYENNAMAGSVFGVYGYDEVLTDAQIQTVIDSIVVDGEDDTRVLHGGACTACSSAMPYTDPSHGATSGGECQALPASCEAIDVSSSPAASEEGDVTSSMVQYKKFLSNLVAHYKFDSAADLLVDSSGNGHHLINDGATFDSTNLNVGTGAVELDNNKFLNLPSTIDPYTIWNGHGITFSVWFYMDSDAPRYSRIFDFGDGSSTENANKRVLISVDNNGASGKTIYFYIDAASSATTYHKNPAGVTTQAWHHITWSIDHNGNWEIYYDNVKELQTSQENIPDFTPTKRYIGESSQAASSISHSDTYTDEFRGEIDDFRIYNRVLTAGEVANLYNKVADPTPHSITFPESPATTGEVLVVSSSTYTHVQNIDLSGEYTVTVGADTSVFTNAAGAVVATSAGGTTYPLPRWVLGAGGATCDDTCANVNMACDSATQTDVDTQNEVDNIAAELGITCTNFYGRSYAGVPFVNEQNQCYYVDLGHTWAAGPPKISASVCNDNAQSSSSELFLEGTLHRPICRCVPATTGFNHAITGELQSYSSPQVILRYKSEVCPTSDTTDPPPCPLDGTYVASCGCPADYYQTTNAGDTTCTPCPDSLVSPAQSTSADHCTQPDKKVTFSLALSGAVSAAEFTPGLRGRIKAKIARNLRVSPKRVTIVSVQDARRRLLAVSLEVEVTAEDEAEAQTLTSETTSITSAVEEAASEENVTLTAELTSSASEAVVATCCFKTWPN